MAKVTAILLLLCMASVHGAPGGSSILPDFYAVDVLQDGEIERRFSLDNLIAKETSAIITFNGTREGAVLKQMAKDDRHMIQLIYDAEENLIDCEYITDAESVSQFRQTFEEEFKRLSSISINSTVRYLSGLSDLPEELSELSNYLKLKKQCRKLHRRIRRSSNGEGMRSKRDLFMMPGTIWCGAGHQASQYSDLGAEQKVDYCCRRHDHCPEVIRSGMTRDSVTNWRLITVSHCDCDERRARNRRSLEDLYFVPHTNWCGKGNRAMEKGSNQLGGYQLADKCCRDHDLHCPHYISAHSEAYSTYNSRPYSAMHCSCDDRFRSCLKQANTAASNMVGKLFFNIIQTKCFVLKPEKVCKKSSWWGKCVQSEWKKKAHLRDPIPY